MLFRKFFFDFMRICILLATVFWTTMGAPLNAVAQDTVEPPGNTISTTTLSNPNPNNWDTPNIMSALSTPHLDLTLLAAHRGLHSLAGLGQTPGVPENSLESIGLAAQAGWEMIELDVKLTSDGQLILSHDKTWGREWCGQGSIFLPGSASPYDPFTPPGSILNDPKNPTVKGTLLSDTRSFFGNTVLRDSVSLLSSIGNNGCNGFHQFSGEYPPTLGDALDYISKNHIRMVVLLDIQGIDIAQAAFSVVQSKTDDVGRTFLNSVVFKMPATLFPNGYTDFVNAFGSGAVGLMNFIPVINTATVAPTSVAIADTEDGGFDLSDVGTNGLGGERSIVTWLVDLETTNRNGLLKIPAVEVNIKEPLGILTQIVLPNAINNWANGTQMTVGMFNPVGEYYPNGTGAEPQFFRSSNGSCCDYLEQYLYNNPNGDASGSKVIDPSQPFDGTDQRRDLNFLLNPGPIGFNYLITDDPSTAQARLVANNRRNICYMQPTAQPSCSSGGLVPVCQSDDPSCQGVGTGGGGQGVGTSGGGQGVVSGVIAPFAPDEVPVPVLSTTTPPSTNFNFSTWELQLPIGSSGSPTTISSSQLLSGFQDEYFFTNSSDGSLGMKDPGTNCVTTPNSQHCRTELREMNADGSPASWLPNGTNKLDVMLQVNNPGGSVVIGQVHLSDSVSVRPLAELYYSANGEISIGVEQTTAGGNQVFTVLGGIPVGTIFNYELNYSNNQLSISINGNPPITLNTFSLGGLPVYFKVGNYGQTTMPSDVHFFSIAATHSSTLNTTAPPGANFDLSVWELQEPTGTPGSPTTISNSQLEGGYQDQYFFTNSSDGSLGMKDPGTNCVTTPNSTHCRTELREVNTDGSSAEWLPNGNNTLAARLAVFNAGGSVCIGQIHLSDSISTKPLAQLFYDDSGNITIGVEQSLGGGDEVLTNVGNVPIGQPFSYVLSYSQNQLSVSLNGGVPIGLSTYAIGHFPVYFKAGAYGQTTSPDDLHFYDLKISHKDHTINVSAPPSGNFNLSYWELQLPTGSAGNPDTISNSQLESGYQSQYFFTNSKDGSLGMMDPGTGCVTTTNSEHCRTELREVNRDGSLAAWIANGTNLLHASLVVDNAGGKVAIGQIHFEESVSNKPLFQLFYDSSGNITAGVEQTLAGGDEVQTVLGNVPVGTPFSYEVNFSNKLLTVSINGGNPFTLPTFGLEGNPVYFKAGAYGQTTSPDDLHFFDLRITHE